MKMISGSILVLAAAMIFQPVVNSPFRLDEAMPFALPPLILGLWMIRRGWKEDSDEKS